LKLFVTISNTGQTKATFGKIHFLNIQIDLNPFCFVRVFFLKPFSHLVFHFFVLKGFSL
jgi:hypothetical protein